MLEVSRALPETRLMTSDVTKELHISLHNVVEVELDGVICISYKTNESIPHTMFHGLMILYDLHRAIFAWWFSSEKRKR